MVITFYHFYLLIGLNICHGSNSHYETDFGVSSAFGAGNTKIGCLKARRWRAFKQPIFIMRTADVTAIAVTYYLRDYFIYLN